MTRKSDPRTTRVPRKNLPAPAGELPAFTPVPRQSQRHDGWTPQRQRTFIEALADTGSVHAAAKAANMSQGGAYYLRRQPGAEQFRKAWQKALDIGVQRIEDVAMDRALNGVDEPLYSYGKLVGTRKRYNDRLLMFMLRNRAPERFGHSASGKGKSDLKGLNAIGKMEKRRLKKKWRAEWEEERNRITPQELHESIDAKVEGLRRAAEAEHVQQWEQLSEETRAAWERFETLRNRDLDALAADEAMRQALQEGPRKRRKLRNADPKDVRRKKPAAEPFDGIRRLKDEGWD